MMRETVVAFKCPVHGHSLHYHACRHVQEAVDFAPHLLPPIGKLDREIICRDCLTSNVEKLFEQFYRVFVVEPVTDEVITSSGVALEALRAKIGYAAVCTECLYERTGLDLRRKSSP